MARHSSTTTLLRWFDYAHLPPHLQEVSAIFHRAATELVNTIPADSPELTTGLRKLLEAKDCAVRAAIGD